MAITRYSRATRLTNGTMIGTSEVHTTIRQAVENGQVSCTTRVLKEGERLDTLAGSLYGDSRYWWIIAAASGIGWGLQVPPGTIITVPELSVILQFIR